MNQPDLAPQTAVSTAAYRITIIPRSPTNNRELITGAHNAGITGLSECVNGRLYFLQGDLSDEDAARLAAELLADPVTEQYAVISDQYSVDGDRSPFTIHNSQFTIETTFLPGVTDPPADNLIRAAKLLGIDGLAQAATGQQYLLQGDLSTADLQRLATEIFANPVIQRFAIDAPIAPPFFPAQTADDTVAHIPLRDADDDALLAISRERRLALDLAEMQAIQAYYRAEQREPTDVELETLAQTWSEHCVHKTFKAIIDYTGPDGETEIIDGILNTYIRAATEEINKPWVRSAFVDNAGIVAFDEQFDLAFKVETHNHPSALEPFGGANTGVGGVVRDVLGVSARPIANTDVLCFGPPDLPHEELPLNVLHPRRVAGGVIHGIEDYGNKMGIPTVNGSIHYHPGYTANPLVYCGCLGILPHGSHPTQPQPGDLIMAIGGRTGRDGLRGATFSSMEMDVETSEIAGTAVQIGNPITEKQVQEVLLRARDERLYTAVTDCGAGGFSSAVGEMGEKIGAAVQLQNVRLKYPGLRPWEIWLSEAQERMVLAVPPANLPRLQALCNGQDVELTRLGVFEPTGRLQIFNGDALVGDLAMDFLHDGLPQRKMKAFWQPGRGAEEQRSRGKNAISSAPPPLHPSAALLALLAHPDIRSKEGVIRRYDHEVQGGTAVKPLTGVANHGPSDATVLVPQSSQFTTHNSQLTIQKGAALSNGINPRYGELDPYAMAWAAVDEAVRNVVAVGADPDQISILDNFCWGNPNLPDRLGALVRCAQGCYDAAVAYQTPFVSGKDSLNNEYTGADGTKHAIPGTLLISALGIVPDVAETVTMDLKRAGNILFVVGETAVELAGSHYFTIHNSQFTIHNSSVPQPIQDPLLRYRAIHRAMRAGLVQAAHDCSEGGLAVALAEMSLAGDLGVDVNLDNVPVNGRLQGNGRLSPDALLFSESLGRLLLEVTPADAGPLADLLAGVPHAAIGTVTKNGRFHLYANGETVINLAVAQLDAAWRGNQEQRSRGAKEQRGRTRPSAPPPLRPSAAHKKPRVMILHANGTNRDHDAALAVALAGGEPEIVHINQLNAGERRLADYGMLVLPGGFSYGDDLGAGVLWALDLRQRFGEGLRAFVRDGRPVLGICNGFQALVKAGILGAGAQGSGALQALGAGENGRGVTLTYNERGHFECRWVLLEPNPNSPCLFTQELDQPIYCPVAHGEGRLAVHDEATLAALQAQNLIALRYSVFSEQYLVNSEQLPATRYPPPATYPANPNGSALDIAALTNPAGNVLGLMPHPENHIFPWQHPRHTRGEGGMDGLRLFKNGMKHA